MKRFLSFVLIALITTLVAHAQKQFEGELHYRSIENHDQLVVDGSCGMAYNGARNTKYIIKGNKVLFVDECTHMRTLMDADNDIVVLYNELIGKGMQFKYSHYEKTYFATFSKEGPSYMGHGTPPSLYRFDKESDVVLMDMQTEYIKGRIENKTAGTDFDIYAIPSYKMPKAYSQIISYGIDIDNLIGKLKWEQTNLIKPVLGGLGNKIAAKVMSKMVDAKVTDMSEAKTYVLNELKEIKERNVDDSEFTIPEGISVDKSESPFKVLKLYKETRAYLLKNNMYPTQVNKDVIYKIDDEWDF